MYRVHMPPVNLFVCKEATMEKLFDVKIQGVRWVSNNPHGACKRCAAMHGQEFYYKPKAGQLSMDQLPRLPLHPNCRCTTMPIQETSTVSAGYEEMETSFPDNLDASPDKPYIKPYMVNETWEQWGLIFRYGTPGFAPIWGKYCGDGWGEGRNIKDPNSEPVVDRSPEDSMDALCQKHDRCYDNDGKLICDEEFVKRLEALGPDPSKWPNPPETELEREYAARYRKAAVRLFKIMAAGRRLNKRRVPEGSGEPLYDL